MHLCFFSRPSYLFDFYDIKIRQKQQLIVYLEIHIICVSKVCSMVTFKLAVLYSNMCCFDAACGFSCKLLKSVYDTIRRSSKSGKYCSLRPPPLEPPFNFNSQWNAHSMKRRVFFEATKTNCDMS